MQPVGYGDRFKMDSVVEWLLGFHQQYPIVGILMILMGLDILIGLCAAIITKSVSSTISQRGMTRKVIMLLLVGVGAVFDPYAGGIPLSKMVAMCFLVTEGISILENSARAGVPIPQPLYDVLQKLKNNEKAAVDVKQVNPTVNIQRASNVDIRTTDGTGDASSVHSDSGVKISGVGRDTNQGK